MISKAKASSMEKGSDTRIWVVDEKDVPYTNENTKYITSPVFHGWKLQVPYLLGERSGNTAAFEISVFLRDFLQSAGKDGVPGCNP